jgi:hypothetical protein
MAAIQQEHYENCQDAAMLLPNAARRGDWRPPRRGDAPQLFLANLPKKRSLDRPADPFATDGPGLGTRPTMVKFKTPHEWARDRTPEQWADHHMKVVIVLIALAVFVSYPMGVFVLDAMSASRHAKAASAAPTAPPIDGSGVVLSSNESTGTLTIQHAGAPRLGLMPGATAFHASSDIIKRTAVGDQVIFRAAKDGDAYTVTELQIPAFKDRSDPG